MRVLKSASRLIYIIKPARLTVHFCRVKKLVALILILLLSFQTFYSAGLTLWFYANRALIASKHCVNKSRPAMHCNGKCYLSKRLKAAEEKESQQAPFSIKQWVETAPFTVNHLDLALGILHPEIIVSNPVMKYFHPINSGPSVFHPPSRS